jgi:C-terminal processing protease CtpA/Prc
VDAFFENVCEENMKLIIFTILLILFTLTITAQDTLSVIKSNVNIISIQDGDLMRKDSWTLVPEARPDVYETSVQSGQKKKVTFITDIDKISFDVEAGKKYDFIIRRGDVSCYTQIKANVLSFWNDKGFWESPALKTPYNPNLSNEEKIAGLSKFWSEAKYNFINFDLVPELDWDKTFVEFIPKVLATKSTLEYYRVLQMFCAKLKDGHTNIYAPDELADEILGTPPIRTRLVEDRVIIIGIYDENLKSEDLAVGQEILKIDGAPVKKYAEENVLPYTSDSTPQSSEITVYQRFLLSGRVGKDVELTIKNSNGTVFSRRVPRLKWQEVNKIVPARKPFEMTTLSGNVAYVKINSMVDGEKADQLFAQNFAEISKADALILDLRENGGGSSGIGYRILSFLVDKPFKQSKWFTREYHPTFRPWSRQDKAFGDENAFEHTLENIKKMRGADVQPFLKPIVVLSSPRTFSAAEDFLVAFKPLKRGLIVGEPSGGSTGQPLIISLPGGGSARICSKHDTFPDGTEFVGVGVKPDILANPRISDFVEGKDAVLEVALQQLRKK